MIILSLFMRPAPWPGRPQVTTSSRSRFRARPDRRAQLARRPAAGAMAGRAAPAAAQAALASRAGERAVARAGGAVQASGAGRRAPHVERRRRRRQGRGAGEQVAGGEGGRRRAARAERAREVEAGVVVDGERSPAHQQVRVLRGAVHVLQEAVGPGDRGERLRTAGRGRRGRRTRVGDEGDREVPAQLRWSIASNSSVPTIHGKPAGSTPAAPPEPAPPRRRAMPRARYSVRTPKGPGPAPVNFRTQRRPSAVSISAGECWPAADLEDAGDPRRRRETRAPPPAWWLPLCGAQIFLLVK